MKSGRESDTPIAVDQCAVNCLDKVAMSAKTYGSRFYHLALNKFRNSHPDFQISFLSFDPLLSNSHQATTVTMYTSWYCTVGKYFFTISNDFATFKLRQLLKCSPLSSKRHCHVWPNVYHQQITIKLFQHLATIFDSYGFNSSTKRAVQHTHAS